MDSWLVEFQMKLDELDARSAARLARWEKRNEDAGSALQERELVVVKSHPRDLKQFGMTEFVAADNWGGFFGPAPVREERFVEPSTTDSDAFSVDVAPIKDIPTALERGAAAADTSVGIGEWSGEMQLITADNWGGLFANDSSFPPPMKVERDAVVIPDNWGGLFGQPTQTSEERSFDLSAVNDFTGSASSVQICISKPKGKPVLLLDFGHSPVEHALPVKAVDTLLLSDSEGRIPSTDLAAPLHTTDSASFVPDTAASNSDVVPVDVAASEYTVTAVSEEIEFEEFPGQIEELEVVLQDSVATLNAAPPTRKAGMRAFVGPPSLHISLVAPGPRAIWDLPAPRPPWRTPLRPPLLRRPQRPPPPQLRRPQHAPPRRRGRPPRPLDRDRRPRLRGRAVWRPAWSSASHTRRLIRHPPWRLASLVQRRRWRGHRILGCALRPDRTVDRVAHALAAAAVFCADVVSAAEGGQLAWVVAAGSVHTNCSTVCLGSSHFFADVPGGVLWEEEVIHSGGDLSDHEVCRQNWLRHSGYVRHCLSVDAIQLIYQMPERDPIPYTVLLGGFPDASRVDEARNLFAELPKKNVVSWSAMLFGYTQVGCIEDADELLKTMLDQPLAARNAMIIGFRKRPMVCAAMAVFSWMCERGDGTWGAIIEASEQNDLMETLSTFCEMLHTEIYPNCPSVISILAVCAAHVVLDFGREMHGAVRRCSLDMDIFVVLASPCTPSVFDKLLTRYTTQFVQSVSSLLFFGAIYICEGDKIFLEMIGPNPVVLEPILAVNQHQPWLPPDELRVIRHLLPHFITDVIAVLGNVTFLVVKSNRGIAISLAFRSTTFAAYALAQCWENLNTSSCATCLCAAAVLVANGLLLHEGKTVESTQLDMKAWLDYNLNSPWPPPSQVQVLLLTEPEPWGLGLQPPWPPPQSNMTLFQLSVSFVLSCRLHQSTFPFLYCVCCQDCWKFLLEFLQGAVQVPELNNFKFTCSWLRLHMFQMFTRQLLGGDKWGLIIPPAFIHHCVFREAVTFTKTGAMPGTCTVLAWLSNWLCPHLLWKPPWWRPALVEILDTGLHDDDADADHENEAKYVIPAELTVKNVAAPLAPLKEPDEDTTYVDAKERLKMVVLMKSNKEMDNALKITAAA